MKRTVMSVVAGALMLSSGAAFAQGAPPPTGGAATTAPNEADCKISDINGALDTAMNAIKASPAMGHAGGHYAKALKDLEGVKKQLDEGCKAWLKGGEKKGAAPAKKK